MRDVKQKVTNAKTNSQAQTTVQWLPKEKGGGEQNAEGNRGQIPGIERRLDFGW